MLLAKFVTNKKVNTNRGSSMKSFNEIIYDVTKFGRKIKTSDYMGNGKYPIIDQGKNLISGYTNEENGIFVDVPAIIFGDHTRILKYIDTPFFLGADGTKILKAKNENCNLKFIYYALKNIKIPDTGYNRHYKWLKESSIIYPAIEHQDKIVNILDRITSIITLKKQQLVFLEKLKHSLFVEMFGDFVENPKCYKKEPIETHVDLLSGYPFKSSQYVDVGINICGGLIIMPQTIKWEDCLHWESADGYEEYMLQENDIVMALDRPWISDGFKIAKVDAEYLPALLIQRTARIRAIDINQEYLYYCFIIGGFERHSSITGSLVPHISLKDIRSFQILIPPLKLQEQFADIVGKIDKHKSVVQKSLDETQLLFDSLMQKYFG